MVFPHRVKYNGIHYLAGQNVPIEDEKPIVEPNTEVKNDVEKVEAVVVKPTTTTRKKAKTKTEV